MKDVAIIIPVHNRRDVTLACLRRLRDDTALDWAHAIVVDDGSTDGTATAIAVEFPAADILTGNGNLWWTGAIERGMRHAYKAGARLFVWLNDDTEPDPGALARLCRTAEETGAIVTGQCFVPPDGPLLYGGLRRRRVALELAHSAGPAPFAVAAACGNLVAIPRAVVDAIGFPDGKHLAHAHGDSDYTLRATAAGIRVLVDPRVRAWARPNALGNYASWLLSDIRSRDIWRPLFDRRSYAYAPAHARLLARHFGAVGAAYWVWTVLKRIPITLLRLIVPTSWLQRCWGRRSAAWQQEQQLRESLARSNDQVTKRP